MCSVLCLSVKDWPHTCMLLCFESLSMRACQGRKKVILDTKVNFLSSGLPTLSG